MLFISNRKKKKNLSLSEYRELKAKGYNHSYCFLSITKGVYPKEIEQLLEKLAKKHNDPEGFTIVPNLVSPTNDDRIRDVLNFLTSPQNKKKTWYIKHKYDYAWIKWAIDKKKCRGCDNYYCKSNPMFVMLLNDLGCIKVPDKKTLTRYYEIIVQNKEDLYFNDCYYNSFQARRRRCIAGKFIEMMNEI